MAGYVVLLTDGAERDLEEIHRYVAKSDSRAKANRLLDRLLEVAEGLETFPERGRVPVELQGLGVREYREVLFGPYRVIYRVMGERVLVYVVADGRRDMQSLLERRLLGA